MYVHILLLSYAMCTTALSDALVTSQVHNLVYTQLLHMLRRKWAVCVDYSQT